VNKHSIIIRNKSRKCKYFVPIQ